MRFLRRGEHLQFRQQKAANQACATDCIQVPISENS